MKYTKNIDLLPFNSSPSSVMHIDLNSCFATIEQQANPFLRGKPIAVAAYTTPAGCILAPSIEAKEYGVKTGMRVRDGKNICPALLVMTSDPNKYRFVHLQIRKILKDYTSEFYPKSIDEYVLRLLGFPVLRQLSMQEIGQEIKSRIKSEIGDWLTVSIGIAPSSFLAKIASNLKKPDGLEEINIQNYKDVYKTLKLKDLHGINVKNEIRLNSVGIYTVSQFYKSELWRTKAAFKSILGRYWHLRLRGWEVDDIEFARRSFGNSYALPHSDGTKKELLPILAKLTQKTGQRLRHAGYRAHGVHLSLSFKDGGYWHRSRLTQSELFSSDDLFKQYAKLLSEVKEIRPVRVLAESCFSLTKNNSLQLELFNDVEKKKSLVQSIDNINAKWGGFAITPALTLDARGKAPDRISFGGVTELCSNPGVST